MRIQDDHFMYCGAKFKNDGANLMKYGAYLINTDGWSNLCCEYFINPSPKYKIACGFCNNACRNYNNPFRYCKNPFLSCNFLSGWCKIS